MKTIAMAVTISVSLFAFGIGARAAGAKNAKGETEIQMNLSTKGNDIAFDKSTLQVPFGKPIKITFKNMAENDSEIYHNIAFMKARDEAGIMEAARKLDWEIEPLRKDPRILTMTTKELAPGESESVRFAPPEPGFYVYLCLMPGHADHMKMKGVMNVVQSRDEKKGEKK